MQFAASKLWDLRDKRRHLITRAAYQQIGGIEGALSVHADQVLERLPGPARKLTRAILLRLITPERTRAIVDVSELRGLADDPREVEALVDELVASRLLVVQSRSDGQERSVELAHESLISEWPTFRRWLDESHEDAAFIEQLRSAARQWDQSQRSAGLLWRGDIAEDARRFQARARVDLIPLERDYLAAVAALAQRASRRRRRLVLGIFLLLGVLVVASGIGFLTIREAEKAAQIERVAAVESADEARRETARAEAEKRKAESAKRESDQRLKEIIELRESESEAKKRAEDSLRLKAKADDQVAMTADQLREALKVARRAEAKEGEARREAEKAARALAQANKKLKAEQERLLRKLKSSKLSTTLK